MLVVSEIALSLVLLVGAGLLMRTLLALQRLTRLLSRLLYGVTASDPATFASVTLALAAVGSCDVRAGSQGDEGGSDDGAAE